MIKLKINYDDEYLVIDCDGVSVSPDLYNSVDDMLEIERYIVFSKHLSELLNTELKIELVSEYEEVWKDKIPKLEEKFGIKINWLEHPFWTY